MARLLFFLIALMLTLPAIADDDDNDRGGEKKTLRAECERQANKQDLAGKDRKKFIKECSKEGKHAKRRGEGRDQGAKPAATQPAAAQPATTAPAPTAATPAQPAAPPAPPATATTPAATAPTATAPAQPTATPAPPATATTPAAAPKPPKPVLTTEQKRLKCSEEAQRAKIALSDRKQFMDKCMAK